MGVTFQRRPSLPHVATDRQPGVNHVRFSRHSFYFFMSLLIAIVVFYGFSRTVSAGLMHPPSPRPTVLYFHAVIFTTWVLFFIVQSALVRMRNVRLHGQLGWFGLALGASIPIVGIATTIAMGRLRLHEGRTDTPQFLIIPFFDMMVFTVAFGLAFYWRKKPEFHRRLSLVATCSLTAAAFGRFPTNLIPHYWFYAGVDSLILLGVLRDLHVAKRIHSVYLYALPLLALGQTAIIHLYVTSWQPWIRIARMLLA